MMTPAEIHDLRIQAVEELNAQGVKNPDPSHIISKMKSIETRGAQSFEALFGRRINNGRE